MKSTALGVAAMAGTAATAAAMLAVTPAAGRTLAATSTAHRIHLVEVQRSSHMFDLGPKGFSAGDRQTITSAIYAPDGSRKGRLDDDCAVTQVGQRPEVICSFVLTLPHGQLTGNFAEDLSGDDVGKRQAITGGTADYAGASGQIVAGREGHRTPFVIVLH